jgi:signal transduction histidine kinase
LDFYILTWSALPVIPPVPSTIGKDNRVDKARTQTDGGSSPSLSISQHIAKVHGGKIKAKSQVGIGSTFTVWLPFYNKTTKEMKQ